MPQNHYASLRNAYRFIMVLALFIVSSVAQATVTWSLPASSSTGNYTISWSGGRSNLEVWENVNGTWVRQSNNGPSGSVAISKTSSGTYSYYLNDCLQGQYGPSCVHTDTRSITVTITAPAPGAPTSVSASPNGMSVNVSWSGVSGATSYNVFRNGSQITTSGGTAYTDNSVAGGSSYTYSVQACNGNGCSPSTGSNTVTVAVPTPAAPTSVSASYSSPSVSISWPAVSGAQTYNTRRTDGVYIGCASNSWTTCTDSNVAGGVTYTYQVSACNGSSNCSVYTSSNPVTITVPLPSTPQTPSVSVSGSAIVIAGYSATGATSYTLTKSGGGTTSSFSNITANSYTDNSVSPGTAYSYTAKACNSSGCSSDSGGASATVPIPIPATPSGLSAATSGNTALAVSWGPVSYATYYVLQRSPTSAAFPTGHISSTSYNDTGLTPSTPYNYNVQACNGSGCSSWSTSLAATTAATIDAATFVSQSVPSAMTAGQSYNVSVTMANNGNSTWTAGAPYALGSQNPHDNVVWGGSRAYLPSPVAPGQQATFAFVVKAPSSAGTYAFQWMMVQDGAHWFGDFTPNVNVTVTKLPAISVRRTPSTPVAGQAFTTSWSTSDAMALTRSCTSSGGGFTDNSTLATSGSAAATANTAWVGNPSTCTWTATGPGGSSSFVETVTTISTIPANAAVMCPYH